MSINNASRDFHSAMKLCLTEGRAIARVAWRACEVEGEAFNGPWVCYMAPMTIPAEMVNTKTRAFIPFGPLELAGYFVFFDGFKWHCGWAPTASDVLADDWECVDTKA